MWGMLQGYLQYTAESGERHRSVEKPASTLHFVRRIFATGRFFVPFGGPKGHAATRLKNVAG
jgi:hypothetical protein